MKNKHPILRKSLSITLALLLALALPLQAIAIEVNVAYGPVEIYDDTVTHFEKPGKDISDFHGGNVTIIDEIKKLTGK